MMRDKSIYIEVGADKTRQTVEQALLSACSLLNSNGYFVEPENGILYETQRTTPITAEFKSPSSLKLPRDAYASHVFGWKFRFDYYVDFMPHEPHRPLN